MCSASFAFPNLGEHTKLVLEFNSIPTIFTIDVRKLRVQIIRASAQCIGFLCNVVQVRRQTSRCPWFYSMSAQTGIHAISVLFDHGMSTHDLNRVIRVAPYRLVGVRE